MWKINLWILWTVCGRPIEDCKQKYRLPAIIAGTGGVVSSFNSVAFLFALSSTSGNNVARDGLQVFLMAVMGVGLLLICRVLIHRGSL